MEIVNILDTPQDSDEEDIGCYFLQPASSPYNMTEKIKEANERLSVEDVPIDDRETKVKFKENLVDYEPDFTYEDASSIESEEELVEDTAILENKLKTSLILEEAFDENILEGVEEEELEEIVHEVIVSDIYCDTEDVEDDFDDIDNKNIHPDLTFDREKPKLKEKNKPQVPKTSEVHCKDHCIDRFDFNINLSIRKINIDVKPQNSFPVLKLQKRKCCESNENKLQTKLPSYSGLRSEYGMSEAQLRRRDKMKQIIKMREMERQRIVQEIRSRKMQQNEQVFCEWLKSVSARKTKTEHRIRSSKKPLTPNVVSLPYKSIDSKLERPKTASELMPRKPLKKSKRPHTSSGCIYIQVPCSFLKKGISVGDLLIKGDNHANGNRLHLLTIT